MRTQVKTFSMNVIVWNREYTRNILLSIKQEHHMNIPPNSSHLNGNTLRFQQQKKIIKIVATLVYA